MRHKWDEQAKHRRVCNRIRESYARLEGRPTPIPKPEIALQLCDDSFAQSHPHTGARICVGHADAVAANDQHATRRLTHFVDRFWRRKHRRVRRLTGLRIFHSLLLTAVMARPARRLIIAVFALLALIAGNFAMASSGMAHAIGSVDPLQTLSACAGDLDGHHATQAADDHPCTASVQEGTCDAGPTCCSSACQALVLAVTPLSMRARIDVPSQWVASAAALDAVIRLERPPRRPALA